MKPIEKLGIILEPKLSQSLMNFMEESVERGSTLLSIILYRNSPVNVGIELMEFPSGDTIWSWMIFDKGRNLQGNKPHIEIRPLSFVSSSVIKRWKKEKIEKETLFKL